MADNKFKYPFRIYSVKTNSFAEKEISEEDSKVFDETKLGFRFKPNFAYDRDAKIVKVNISVVYEYEDVELLSIDSDVIFEFDSFDDVVLDDDAVDKNILSMLFGIAFSTVRGIIINRTVGSFINRFYLPIINPSEIIK